MEVCIAILDVEGMTCDSCVKNIESNVGKLPGLISIQVTLSSKEALVKVDKTVISVDAVAEKINDMGFIATVRNPPKDGIATGPSSESTAEGKEADSSPATKGASPR
ncbi:hypothetical protein J437_LFUL011923 [Ladona fulva]|uniref:HMA domain-containing protein n=1 Tax=Ladona fulva TaxID=123851 RepID=A0A8K0NY69_LADFU|nr:hypothetical protein J437_LFUL011923 [Ladona fulva]